MYKYINRTILLLICAVCLFACQKGTLQQGGFSGGLKVELLNLPGTPVMEMYFNDQLIDSLPPGGILGVNPFIVLPAGKEGALSFRNRETGALLLDSVIVIPNEQQVAYKLAYSEELGLKTFLNPTAISRDSVRVQFYNNVSDVLIPADVTVKAFLEREVPFNSANYEPTGIQLSTFTKYQLNPVVVTLPVLHPDGNPINYRLQYQDAVTGNAITDQYATQGPLISFLNSEGQYLIIFAEQSTLRGKLRFNARLVAL